MLELREITLDSYPTEKDTMFALVDKIWTHSEDSAQAKHSIDRWGTSRSESGTYFYITEDSVPVGLTGYFIPNLERGIFGLRHHGTSVKGLGRPSLNLLFDYLREKYGEQFRSIVELIPEGREDLIPRFTKWGFEVDPEGVPDWEPKKEYYEHSMVFKRGKESTG